MFMDWITELYEDTKYMHFTKTQPYIMPLLKNTIMPLIHIKHFILTLGVEFFLARLLYFSVNIPTQMLYTHIFQQLDQPTAHKLVN